MADGRPAPVGSNSGPLDTSNGSIAGSSRSSILDRPPLTDAAIAAALRDRYGLIPATWIPARPVPGQRARTISNDEAALYIRVDTYATIAMLRRRQRRGW